MVRRRSSVWVASWVSLWVVAACSDPPASSQPAVGGSNVSGSGGSSSQVPPACYVGADCLCESGLTGETRCDAQQQASCDCTNCPTFSETPAVGFQPCGGEPFGLWDGTELGTDGLAFKLYQQAAGGVALAGSCPTQVNQLEALSPLRLALFDGGALQMVLGALETSFSFLDSCAKSTVSQSCTQLDLATGACTEACGICTCDSNVPAQSDEGSWTRTDSHLSFTFGWELDYCVEGDVMTMRDADGVLFKMRRVYPFAKPTACAERTAETCISGCSLGACEGVETCSFAQAELECTNRLGCSWNPAACAGQPQACTLSDFDTVPGCDFLENAVSCVGQRPPCRMLTADECATAPGCEIGPGCTGGAVNCGALVGSCSFCTGVDGCGTCGQGSAVCTGDSTCEQQDSASSCGRVEQYGMGACTWTEGLCVGEPVPCEELVPEVCEGVPGCTLQPVTE